MIGWGGVAAPPKYFFSGARTFLSAIESVTPFAEENRY
jgi:hypothetical protein